MQLRAQRFEEELAMLEARLADEHTANDTLARGMRLSTEGGASGEALPTLADFNQAQAELSELRKRSEELEAEREALARQLKEAESWGRTLEEEEARLRSQMSELQAERDEARVNLQEVEGRMNAVEEEFIAAQEKSREQREAATEVIRQLETEREENRNRLSELEARSQWLEEELSAVRRQLQEAGLPVNESAGAPDARDLYWRLTVPLTLVMVSTDLLAMSAQTSPQMREAVRAIQQESRRMLDSLRLRGVVPPAAERAADVFPSATD
jgi:chromosome segregation ATPase